jgi:hypothetical protein
MTHDSNVAVAVQTHRQMFGLDALMAPKIEYPKPRPVDYAKIDEDVADDLWNSLSPLQKYEYDMMYDSDYAYDQLHD